MDASGLSLGQEMDRLSPDRRSDKIEDVQRSEEQSRRNVQDCFIDKPDMLTTVSIQIKLE